MAFTLRSLLLPAMTACRNLARAVLLRALAFLRAPSLYNKNAWVLPHCDKIDRDNSQKLTFAAASFGFEANGSAA